jgi:hypothetical protein
MMYTHVWIQLVLGLVLFNSFDVLNSSFYATHSINIIILLSLAALSIMTYLPSLILYTSGAYSTSHSISTLAKSRIYTLPLVSIISEYTTQSTFL